MASGATQKVFLEKRLQGATGPTSGGGGPMGVSTGADLGVTCSICGDLLPGPRELGVHILAAHCDPQQQEEIEKEATQRMEDEDMVDDSNIEDDDDDDDLDNLVIDGVPGETMEVEVDPLADVPDQQGNKSLPHLPDTKSGLSAPTINLPRQPTANELKQKFMAYRLSDTSNRYICLVCDKMYTSRYNIRMHMNLHTGNNVHTCVFCGRKFAHKHVYESHVRTHTGERPFACEKCDRKFGDRSNCASHMKRCIGVNFDSSNPSSPKEEEANAHSINIAPNVSITPINKLRKSETADTNMSNMFNYPKVESSNGQQQKQQQQPSLVVLNFQPQIVSVQSMSGANSDDFENMGYVGEDDEEEADEGQRTGENNGSGGDEDSEEVMIEPDISLDYDDIEEIAEKEEGGKVELRVGGGGSTIYTCSFCAVKYEDHNMLMDHLTNHVDIPHSPAQFEVEQGYMTLYTSCRPKFMCLSCGKFFTSVDSINIHLKVHFDETIYECELCSQVFNHKHIYENHRRSEHGLVGSGSGGIVRSFNTINNNNNNNNNSSTSSMIVNISEQECQHCCNVFPSAISLNNHLRSCRQKPPSMFNTSKVNNNNSSSSTLVVTNVSTVNGTAAAQNGVVEKKLKPKANRPPPKLIMLNSDPSKVTKLEGSDHIIIAQRPPVQKLISIGESLINAARKPITIAPKPMESLLSEEAKKIFNNSAPKKSPSSSNPRAHKIVETPAGREYIPDTNSNNIINLDTIYPPPSDTEVKRGYMLRPCGHGGQQRYVCVDCGKHYTTSYNVRMHRNIHIGKNLYTCKFCKKEFSHKHVWETHERVHTGERPFKCPTCPKDFADRSNYNSHKKICLRLQQQARCGGGQTGGLEDSLTEGLV